MNGDAVKIPIEIILLVKLKKKRMFNVFSVSPFILQRPRPSLAEGSSYSDTSIVLSKSVLMMLCILMMYIDYVVACRLVTV